MKSTLPALFQLQQPNSSRSSYNNNNNNNQLTKSFSHNTHNSHNSHTSHNPSPEKQPNYYNLKLDQPFANSYRTKIINPHHEKSTIENRLPRAAKLNYGLKQRYGGYPSRSLSMHGVYEEDRDGRDRKNMGTLDFDRSQQLKANSSTISYSYNKSKSINTSIYMPLQHPDNPTQQQKNLTYLTHLLQKSIEDLPTPINTLALGLQSLKIKMNSQINAIESEYKDKIKNLECLLSELRRQTNLEIKEMRRDVELIEEDVREGKELLANLEKERVYITRVNF